MPVLAEIPGFPETGLADRTAFWKKVFTTYGKDDLIIHDRERVNLIYDVVDEKSRRSGVARVCRLLNEARRSCLAAILRSCIRTANRCDIPAFP